MTGVPIRIAKTQKHAQKEDHGRTEERHAHREEMECAKQGARPGTDPFLTAFRRDPPGWHLDFRLQAPITVSK